jgi:hypothetical protein
LVGTFAGVLLLAGVGCGEVEPGDPGTAGGDESAQAAGDESTQPGKALRRRPRRPPPSQPPPTTGGGGAGGGSSSGLTTEQVIKAAQTADGAAIPQPAGPNGACPEVVVRLGFWSCPTIGETCSSPTRQCTCSRTDGEGQLPSWICN